MFNKASPRRPMRLPDWERLLDTPVCVRVGTMMAQRALVVVEEITWWLGEVMMDGMGADGPAR